MGALWRKIPITHWTMLIGTLAIAGIPPLAGFFSKDAVLADSFLFGFWWVWLIGLVVAGMTAFYMWRLMGKTFYGKSHVDPAVEPKIHESPRSMTIPLILLAIPSALIGIVLGLPFGNATINQWLEPVFGRSEAILKHTTHSFEAFGIDGELILLSVAVATTGLVIAMRLFGYFRRDGQGNRVAALTARVPRLYQGSFRKWYFDDLNDVLFVRMGGVVVNAAAWFDVHVIDGAVNGVAQAAQGAGKGVRQIQTGRVKNYALGIAAGLIVVAVSYILLATR
jgi:NADH-quinone oxidoreductase subunit L